MNLEWNDIISRTRLFAPLDRITKGNCYREVEALFSKNVERRIAK